MSQGQLLAGRSTIVLLLNQFVGGASAVLVALLLLLKQLLFAHFWRLGLRGRLFGGAQILLTVRILVNFENLVRYGSIFFRFLWLLRALFVFKKVFVVTILRVLKQVLKLLALTLIVHLFLLLLLFTKVLHGHLLVMFPHIVKEVIIFRIQDHIHIHFHVLSERLLSYLLVIVRVGSGSETSGSDTLSIFMEYPSNLLVRVLLVELLVE